MTRRFENVYAEYAAVSLNHCRDTSRTLADEIRVGDEELPERDDVRAPARHRYFGEPLVVALFTTHASRPPQRRGTPR